MICRRLCILIFVLFKSTVFAQDYPYWFLHQGKLDCQSSVVGYAKPAEYQASSAAQAHQNAFENISLINTMVSGKQGFHTTEIGAFWLGSDINAQGDTVKSNYLSLQYTAVDTFFSDHLVCVVIMKDGKIKDQHKRRIPCAAQQKPTWVTTLPKKEDMLFALGAAPSYYYEISSWQEAENNARLNLARSVQVKIQSLEKEYLQYQRIDSETVSTSLSDVSVAARYRDFETNLYYVLLQMPIPKKTKILNAEINQNCEKDSLK